VEDKTKWTFVERGGGGEKSVLLPYKFVEQLGEEGEEKEEPPEEYLPAFVVSLGGGERKEGGGGGGRGKDVNPKHKMWPGLQRGGKKKKKGRGSC